MLFASNVCHIRSAVWQVFNRVKFYILITDLIWICCNHCTWFWLLRKLPEQKCSKIFKHSFIFHWILQVEWLSWKLKVNYDGYDLPCTCLCTKHLPKLKVQPLFLLTFDSDGTEDIFVAWIVCNCMSNKSYNWTYGFAFEWLCRQ